jgi:hypothetical protein
VRWNYTKTLVTLAAVGGVIRYAAAVVLLADPWAEHAIGGGPAAAIVWLILLGPVFAAADLVGSWRERRVSKLIASVRPIRDPALATRSRA